MRSRFLTVAAMLAALALCAAQDAPSVIGADTLKAGEYQGKLVAQPGSDGHFTLRTERYEPKDAGAARRAVDQLNADIDRARRTEQQVAVNGTAQQLHDLNSLYGQIRKKISQHRDLFNVISQDYDFRAADNMVVRFLQPPVLYDEKGDRRKLSLLDLQEMRGFDPNLPGYEAKASDLQPNQVIRVSLRPAKSSGDKTGPKMEVTMTVIVIQEDLTPVKQEPREPAKKRKGK